MTAAVSFTQRIVQSQRFEDGVRDKLLKSGFSVSQYGQETQFGEDFRRRLLGCGDDATAMFLRYKPDFALVLNRKSASYLCEVKSAEGKDGSGNVYRHFCYEVESYLIAKKLSTIGVRSFVVFGDWSAAWISNLRFTRIHVPTRYSQEEFHGIRDRYQAEPLLGGLSIYHREVRRTGSGTPLGLVSKDQFSPLDIFLSRIEDVSEPQTAKLTGPALIVANMLSSLCGNIDERLEKLELAAVKRIPAQDRERW